MSREASATSQPSAHIQGARTGAKQRREPRSAAATLLLAVRIAVRSAREFIPTQVRAVCQVSRKVAGLCDQCQRAHAVQKRHGAAAPLGQRHAREPLQVCERQNECRYRFGGSSGSLITQGEMETPLTTNRPVRKGDNGCLSNGRSDRSQKTSKAVHLVRNVERRGLYRCIPESPTVPSNVQTWDRVTPSAKALLHPIRHLLFLFL
jgi:hypothetical protein